MLGWIVRCLAVAGFSLVVGCCSNQPQDAALRRVALFVPSGHCWQRQWSRCIIRIPFVDAGDTQRQLPECGNAPVVMLTLAMSSL